MNRRALTMTAVRLLGAGVLSCSALQCFADVIPEETWRQVKALRGIPSQPGMNAPSLYVFFDPNCPWCAKLWSLQVNGQPFSERPVIWIPVTYLGTDSIGKGAALLRTAAKAELALNFEKFNYELRLGATSPVVPTAGERLALGRAKALWLRLGGATPLFIYRTAQGEGRLLLGLPSLKRLTELVSTVAPSRLSAFPEK